MAHTRKYPIAYKPDKDTKNLLWSWRQDINDGLWIMVYVWENEESMQAATSFENKDYIACFVGVPYYLDKTTGKRRDDSLLFGEIHLVKDMFGATVVAHELQHFILAWMNEFGSEDHEGICRLAGVVTGKFWEEYYLHEEKGDKA